MGILMEKVKFAAIHYIAAKQLLAGRQEGRPTCKSSAIHTNTRELLMGNGLT